MIEAIRARIQAQIEAEIVEIQRDIYRGPEGVLAYARQNGYIRGLEKALNLLDAPQQGTGE